MQPIYTFNDTSIEIQIIEKDCYYKANIPNNEANKMLIENTIFKFEKSGSVIIMHDDVHVFQLYKLECNYSDYIEMKDQLEHLKNENDILKQELSKNEKELVNFKNDLIQQMKNEMVQLKNELFDTNKLFVKEIEKVNDKSVEVSKDMEQLNNDLQQQINIASYYSPVVFCGTRQYQYYGDEPCTNIIQVLTEHQKNLFCATKIRITNCSHLSWPTSNIYSNKYTILIPQKKTVMLFKKGDLRQGIQSSIEIYSSGIHNIIYCCQFFWCGKEDDIDDFINTLKNVGFNCDNIIKY